LNQSSLGTDSTKGLKHDEQKNIFGDIEACVLSLNLLDRLERKNIDSWFNSKCHHCLAWSQMLQVPALSCSELVYGATLCPKSSLETRKRHRQGIATSMSPSPFETALLSQWSLRTAFIQAVPRGLKRLSIQAPHAFPLLASLISLLVRSCLLWPKVVDFRHASQAHHGPPEAFIGPSHCKFQLDASR
jgi:hypothetical protein